MGVPIYVLFREGMKRHPLLKDLPWLQVIAVASHPGPGDDEDFSESDGSGAACKLPAFFCLSYRNYYIFRVHSTTYGTIMPLEYRTIQTLSLSLS